MDLFDKEEVAAPSVEAAIQTVVAQVATPPAAPAKSSVECTRDTRGEADCDVKDCENCN